MQRGLHVFTHAVLSTYRGGFGEPKGKGAFVLLLHWTWGMMKATTSYQLLS